MIKKIAFILLTTFASWTVFDSKASAQCLNIINEEVEKAIQAQRVMNSFQVVLAAIILVKASHVFKSLAVIPLLGLPSDEQMKLPASSPLFQLIQLLTEAELEFSAEGEEEKVPTPMLKGIYARVFGALPEVFGEKERSRYKIVASGVRELNRDEAVCDLPKFWTFDQIASHLETYVAQRELSSDPALQAVEVEIDADLYLDHLGSVDGSVN